MAPMRNGNGEGALVVRQSGKQGAEKTIGLTGGTISFGPTDVAGDGVIKFQIALRGGYTVGSINRLRIYAAGTPIVDIDNTWLRVLNSRITPSHVLQTASATNFSIPLNMPGISPYWGEQDAVQFPPASACSVELDIDPLTPAPAVGSATIGWVKTSARPVARPNIRAFALGIPLGSTDYRYPIQAPGQVIGFGLPTRGIGQMRLILGGVTIADKTGPCYQGTDAAPNAGADTLTNWQLDEDSAAIVATGRRFWRTTPIGAPAGSSELILTTPLTGNAATEWGGPTESMLLYTVENL